MNLPFKNFPGYAFKYVSGMIAAIILILFAFTISRPFYGLASLGYFVRTLGVLIFIFYAIKYLRLFDRSAYAARIAQKVYIFILAAGFLFFVYLQILIIAHEQGDAIPPNVNTVLVLGAGLHGDRPSATLYSRLEKAAAYLLAYPDASAVLCGGQGNDELISEAEAMRRYLENAGISAARLILEDQSTSTRENIANARLLINGIMNISPGTEIPVIIISNEFHLYRAKYIAEKYHFKGYGLACPTPAIKLLPLYYRFREGASIIFAYLDRG
ncbi:MAG: YdcF family protein [Syntrophomonadaceae bacterium]|nr:YdcF family protein [Syntrophomonadaceae bacterium]